MLLGSGILEVRRRLCVSPLLGLLAGALCLSAPLTAALELDRRAVVAGEWWRVVTCHWTHPGIEALAWDVLVFVFVGTLLERRDRRQFLLVLAGAVLAIPLGLLALAPELGAYRGLSGIDSALFGTLAAGIVVESARAGDRRGLVLGVLALAAFAAKLAWESATGDTLFVRDLGGGFVSEPRAHLIGALAGASVGVCSAARRAAGDYSLRPVFSSAM